MDHQRYAFRLVPAAVLGIALLVLSVTVEQGRSGEPPRGPDTPAIIHREQPEDTPDVHRPVVPAVIVARSGPVVRDSFVSIQVNVDADGNNIPGDAANEPSIAVDPKNPAKMAIGWRQFATTSNNFRQGGWAYSQDGGQTWTFPGVINQTEFASDPVLDVDADGVFYYYSLQPNRGPGNWACYMYRSFDGGVTWPDEHYAGGGDKAWFVIDKTGGPGNGHIYVGWNPNATCCNGIFNRSLNGGVTFSTAQPLPVNIWSGTLAVGPDGELYLAGATNNGVFWVLKSTNATNPTGAVNFTQSVLINLGGARASGGPNPAGLLGQVWIAVDTSTGPRRGYVYVLASATPLTGNDPLDVMFIRSTDGGMTWSDPVRVNDDLPNNGAFQWFGTMSVSPDGRIDVIWNDTRNSPSVNESELYYAQSSDGGMTWSANVPLSPPFNHFLGYPSQNKLGDYYDMVSDKTGAHIAYAATFNGEQDVYYLRIGTDDCNENGVPDDEDIANGTSEDCDGNGLPDECSPDCNDNGKTDSCEVLFGGANDCNGNLLPDECDPDYDLDGTIDACDPDIDGDGVPNTVDLCPRTLLGFPVKGNGGPMGDINADCRITLEDYDDFRNCFFGGPGEPLIDFICGVIFDADRDGNMDLKDFRWFQLGFGK